MKARNAEEKFNELADEPKALTEDDGNE